MGRQRFVRAQCPTGTALILQFEVFVSSALAVGQFKGSLHIFVGIKLVSIFPM